MSKFKDGSIQFRNLAGSGLVTFKEFCNIITKCFYWIFQFRYKILILGNKYLGGKNINTMYDDFA